MDYSTALVLGLRNSEDFQRDLEEYFASRHAAAIARRHRFATYRRRFAAGRSSVPLTPAVVS